MFTFDPEYVLIPEREAAFNISPLCGGVPPDIAWTYLERFAGLMETTS